MKDLRKLVHKFRFRTMEFGNTDHGRPFFIRIWWLLLLIAPASGVQAQTQANLVFHVPVPVIALIDVEPQGNNLVTLSIPPPGEAGEGMDGAEVISNLLWLNYTTSRTVNGPLRNIQVQLSGLVPPGLILRLSASPRNPACGGGLFGTPGPQITLGNAVQTLIYGLGGSFTGDGTGCGHQLRYSLEISDYGQLEQVQNSTLQVIYTLVDN